MESEEEQEEEMEGADQRERVKALLEYGFKCQCNRCLEEMRISKEQMEGISRVYSPP